MRGHGWLSVTYLLYAVFYLGLIWVGGMYVILHHNWSQWWLLGLCVASAYLIRPRAWGAMMRPGDELDDME